MFLNFAIDRKRCLNMTTVVALLNIVSGFSPSFAAPVANITVARGRDAKFTCKVRHLGGYRVGWVKADTKAIQAIHTHVITHNPRVHVTYDDHSTWHLILKQLTEEDKGPYMCQINTDPMISQIGYLEVVTPPEIDDVYSTSDVVVTEGSSAQLRCVARGNPQPEITWRREDEGGILISEGGKTTSVTTVKGEVLELPKVTRDHMGAYMCIANNKVPPQVSKRITLEVHFHPLINVPNQLIGSPYGRNVTIQCNIEASPPPVTFWNNVNKEMLSNSSKYYVTSEQVGYGVKMRLTLIDLSATDIGDYKCVARNSIGKVESIIRINYIQPPTDPPTPRSSHVTYISSGDNSAYGATHHGSSPPLDEEEDIAPMSRDNEIWASSSSDPWSQKTPVSGKDSTTNTIQIPMIPSFIDKNGENNKSWGLSGNYIQTVANLLLLGIISRW